MEAAEQTVKDAFEERSIDATMRLTHSMSPTVVLRDDKDAERVFRLSKVLFVPDLSCNLFSVRDITDKGNRMRFDDVTCSIISTSGQLGECKWAQSRESVCVRWDHE